MLRTKHWWDSEALSIPSRRPNANQSTSIPIHIIYPANQRDKSPLFQKAIRDSLEHQSKKRTQPRSATKGFASLPFLR
jgi:hypothetical protein